MEQVATPVEQQAPTEPAKEGKEEVKPVETPPEPPKQDDKFASKFAALSRREKEARALMTQAKETQKEVEAWRKELEEGKKDPLSFLESKFGVTFDDLTAKRLERGPVNKESEEVKTLREELDALKNERLTEKEQRQLAARDEAVNRFKSGIAGEIEANKDKYPILSVQNGEAPLAGIVGTDLVYDVIDIRYQNTGEVLKTGEAMEIIEKHLEKALEGILVLPKVKELYEKLSKPKEEPKAPPSKSKTESKTLTNAQAAPATPRSTGRMNDAQDLKRATEILQSRLSA